MQILIKAKLIEKQLFVEMNIKTVIKFLRFLLTIICIIGLFYQTIQLLNQFLSGKTVVNIEIGRRVDAPLPAITICYPLPYSVLRISKLSPNLKLLSESYEKLNHDLVYTNWSTGNSNAIKLMSDMNSIYLGNMRNELRDLISKNNGSFYFDQISLPFKYINTIYSKEINKLVEIQIFGSFDRSSLNNELYLESKFIIKLYYNGTPIESIVPIFNDDVRKCFTFFSSLQKQWRNFQMNLENMKLSFNINNQLFPFFFRNKIFIAVHSPNTLPDFTLATQFKTIELNGDYSLFYASLESHLLGSDYDTNCVDYDLDHKFANFNMRSDCMTSCIQRKTQFPNKELGYNHALLRRDLFAKNVNLRVKFNFNKDLYDFRRECSQICHRDCHFVYYQTDIVHDHALPGDNIYNSCHGSLRIDFKHNSLPDIVVRHIPEITFISFVSNFGGLLGIWLGFNVLVICEEVLKLFEKMIKMTRPIQITNNIRINHNIQNNMFNLRTYKVEN